MLPPKENNCEISLNPPPGFFECIVFISLIYCHLYSILIYYIFILKIKASEIPGVGELMAASFPMDPKFNESFPENTWY